MNYIETRREVISCYRGGDRHHFTPTDFLEGIAPRYDASKDSFNRFEFQQEFLVPRLLRFELSHLAKDELDPRAIVCTREG